MMYSNFLCKTLLNISLRSRLNIKIMHSDFVFYTVLIQNVNSFKTVRINLLFLFLFNFIKKNYVSLLSQQSALQSAFLIALQLCFSM